MSARRALFFSSPRKCGGGAHPYKAPEEAEAQGGRRLNPELAQWLLTSVQFKVTWGCGEESAEVSRWSQRLGNNAASKSELLPNFF